MARPASGSATLLGLGRERLNQFGVPNGSLIKYLVNLPVAGRLVGEENLSGQVNPSGYRLKGIPGAKGGEMEWGHPLTPAHMLEMYEHILGKVTKTTLEAGPPAVYQYVFEPDFANHKNTSLWGLMQLPPVLLWMIFGVMFEELSMEIGDNDPIQARLSGQIGHGTKLGPADASAANTGTYAYVPWLRGVIADPTAGPVWLRKGAGDEVKVLQAAAEPDAAAWTAAATSYPVARHTDGEGIWQNAQSSDDGLDLGIFAENKDPLEFVFPGSAADLADAAEGDVWGFAMPNAWEPPAMTELTGYTRFTSAHWRTFFRDLGAGAWTEKGGFTGSMSLGWPLKVARGNSSRYPTDMYREGQFEGGIELTRDLLDTYFEGKLERHERIETRHLFEGRQLGTGEFRESIDHVCPSVGIPEYEADPGDEGAVEENVTLSMETNDAGDPPVTITVITDRDWTPTA